MATTRKAAAKPQKVERKFMQTLWLILLIIESLLGIILILDLTNRPEDPSRPYLLAALFILSTTKLVGVFGIWMWEKWGLYTYAGAVIGMTVIGLMLTGTTLIVFYELLPVAITGWLFREQIPNFK